MIGPHEDKELELMLSGEKHLAVFYDFLPESGIISENIIPDEAFKPYVDSDSISRQFADFYSDKHSRKIRYVFFSLHNEEWRIEAYKNILSKRYSGEKHHPLDDVFLGKLLGYSHSDIEEFLSINT